MTQRIARTMSDSIPVTIPAVADIATQGTNVMMGEQAGGIIHMTAVSGATATLQFYSAPDVQTPNTLYQIRDNNNNIVTLTVENNRAYALPDELFATRAFRVAAATGTASAVILLKT